ERGAPARRPGRDRADLRHPTLDRAKLQAGQDQLGRLPGPLRHRDPPSPGPGQLRLQLLLGHLTRRPSRDGATPDGIPPWREEAIRRLTADGAVLAASVARDTRLALV